MFKILQTGFQKMGQMNILFEKAKVDILEDVCSKCSQRNSFFLGRFVVAFFPNFTEQEHLRDFETFLTS